MFRKINIKEELFRDRPGFPVIEKKLMDEVRKMLCASEENDTEILKRLQKGIQKNETIEPAGLCPGEENSVFCLEKIRDICVSYRLRFLDSKYFRGEYPYEAIIRIREFEKRHNIKVKQFKVMAPTRLFRLVDPDKDPVLFANMGDGNYYFLHQWGNDMAWYRKLLAWPVRNLRNLLATILSFSLLFTALIPSEILVNGEPAFGQTYPLRMIFFLQISLASFFLLINIGLRGNKNLSEAEWDNRFLY